MAPRTSLHASLAALLVAIAPCAPARDVESLQPLLLEALDRGTAQGTLVGPIATTFARLFKTTSPLQFTVRRMRQLTSDCGRLEVTATQAGVYDRSSKTVSDKAQDKRLTYEVSICSDGSPYSTTDKGPSK